MPGTFKDFLHEIKTIIDNIPANKIDDDVAETSRLIQVNNYNNM